MRFAIFLILVILAAATVLTIRWFVFPNQYIPQRADAVVVNAGGEGERLWKAVELMDAGIAPLLVVSRGQNEWIGQPAINKLCGKENLEFNIRCIVAPVDSTEGEGQSFAEFAHQEGLSHLVVVTNDHHLFRARLWLRRYFEGTVDGVGAGGEATMRKYLHEWGGVILALWRA